MSPKYGAWSLSQVLFLYTKTQLRFPFNMTWYFMMENFIWSHWQGWVQFHFENYLHYFSINFLYIFLSLMNNCNCKTTLQQCHSSGTNTTGYYDCLVPDQENRKAMNKTILKLHLLLLLNMLPIYLTNICCGINNHLWN